MLLIACANLANLMLARSVTQRQQIAVRAALGAQRKQLVQRALVECLLLAMLGGLAGVLVAWGGAKLILHLAFAHDPISISASPSLTVLGFAFAASLVTGLLFGVAPAWMAAQADPIEALRGANRSTGRHETFAQKALVVAQAAVSVVLLCAAGLLILSLRKLEHQHFGFDADAPDHRAVQRATAGLKPEQLDDFYRKVNDSLSADSGRGAGGVVDVEPDGREQLQRERLHRRAAGAAAGIGGECDVVGAGEPELLCDDRDEGAGGARFHGQRQPDDSQAVAIVDEAFVKKFLHGENPIGAHFGDWDAAHPAVYTIVGVVENAQYWPPNDPQEAGTSDVFSAVGAVGGAGAHDAGGAQVMRSS